MEDRGKLGSIFNEIYGPIMIGPSSSHTAGPARIGKIAHMLLEEEIAEIEITFDHEGSFAATYTSQGSDFGFVGGLLGIDISDETIKNSLKIAAEQNVKVDFHIAKLEQATHPNFALLNLKGKHGKRVSIDGISTGGGMFEVTRYNEFPVSLKGDCFELLIITEKTEIIKQIKALLEETEALIKDATEQRSGRYLLNLKLNRDIPKEMISGLKAWPGVELVNYIEPILPVIKRNSGQVPYTNATQALEYAKARGRTLWEIASDYEEAISGKSRREVMAMMGQIVQIMRQSARKGIEGNFPQRGFLTSKAGIMDTNMKKENARFLDLGILNKVMVWATAVMEYDICMGKIVAAPTGGSSGVIPGALVALGDELGLSDEEIAKGLLAAGVVGIFIYHQATFAAEICGCQAENGSAGGMAAAGVVQLLGGTVSEAFSAASLALQNILGLICDPVAGVGNVPCVSRNAMAAANAVVSANMVLNGFDPFIPLDETIQAMWEVGRLMPKEFRCTGLGGLCITESAKRAAREFKLNAQKVFQPN